MTSLANLIRDEDFESPSAFLGWKINGRKVVGMEEIQVTESRKIVIQKSKYTGADTLDIRTWLKTPNYEGFTRKGVNIPIEKAEELAQKILKVVKEG